jgi:hypothetical protein
MYQLKQLSINLKDPRLKEKGISAQSIMLFRELKDLNEWIDINVRS